MSKKVVKKGPAKKLKKGSPDVTVASDPAWEDPVFCAAAEEGAAEGQAYLAKVAEEEEAEALHQKELAKARQAEREQ